MAVAEAGPKIIDHCWYCDDPLIGAIRVDGFDFCSERCAAQYERELLGEIHHGEADMPPIAA